MRKTALFLACCFSCLAVCGQIQRHEIEEVIKGKRATVGVAILHQDSLFTLNNDCRYPLMSAFKFHVAVAALKKMEQERIPTDSLVRIGPEQLAPNTYSPLRDKYPHQCVSLSLREMLHYTISLSDNNTCDWLIEFAGGIGQVGACIRSLGIRDFSLTETERSMHDDILNSYRNWSTPLSMACLLKKVYTENVLGEVYFRALEEAMLQTSSGKDKLKAGLPAEVPIGHKTGHSDRTTDGVQIGETDAGVIYLPGGGQCYIVVFVKDSKETDATNARIISDVARLAYRGLAGGK